MNRLGISIQGVTFAVDENKNIDHDEFTDKFIDFIESNGWYFGGGTVLIDEDGNAYKDESITKMEPTN